MQKNVSLFLEGTVLPDKVFYDKMPGWTGIPVSLKENISYFNTYLASHKGYPRQRQCMVKFHLLASNWHGEWID